jgi:maltose alpha-D-glucosyltransferase/alpha-amylase
MAFATDAVAEQLRAASPFAVIAELAAGGRRGVLHDALSSPAFGQALLEMICARRRSKGLHGEVEGSRLPGWRRIVGDAAPPPPAAHKTEQSNSALLYGDRCLLKLFRRLDVGINPDLEISRFLTRQDFRHVPPVVGALEYCGPKEECRSLAMVSGYVANAKDGWVMALDALGRYYDRASALSARGERPPVCGGDWVLVGASDPSPPVLEIVGTYLESARQLGERTAELHLALAADPEDQAFAPEPFTPHYVRGLFQSMRNLAMQNLRLLRKQLKALPEDVVPLAERVLAREAEIIQRYRPLFEQRMVARRIRVHGDYHLGQVLWTGRDFVILDFEGEPAVALGERRIKRSPLRDVAGMMRSFQYAAYAGLYQQVERGSLPPENLAGFEPWARCWNRVVSRAYLRSYLEALGPSELLPASAEHRQLLLQASLMNKAVYELGYELNHRPDWLRIPLRGILELLEPAP